MLRTKSRLHITAGMFAVLLAAMGIELFLQSRQNSLDQALSAAVRETNPERVDLLLRQGANVNAEIHRGSEVSIAHQIRHLLKHVWHGAEQRPADTGQTALDVLLQNLQESQAFDDIAADLIDHGAHTGHYVPYVESGGVVERTLLHVASLSALHETVRCLLRRGADVNARDPDGATPVMGADAASILLLVHYAADVNAKDNRGWAPLMYPTFQPRGIEAVRVLLQYGADVKAVDREGHSVLYHYTNFGGFDDRQTIAHLLEQHGARLNGQDKAALE